MHQKKIYFCIDLRSFYASCECVERDLDPLMSNLVVADASRGKGALCLAVSYHLKEQGVKNRCRLFEIGKDKTYIIARPRMQLYIDYAVRIYKLYQKYFAKEDIHVYSIDEMFIDVSKYLDLYRMDENHLALFILRKIKEETGLVATCGIGTNLYLAKIALDIFAKKAEDGISYLDEEKYVKLLGNHTPLTDFWMIAKGISNRLLNKFNVRTMNELKKVDEKLLYDEFGVDAEILIDHAYGKESVTLEDIRNYTPISNSFSSSQILFRDYDVNEAKIILVEMISELSLRLIKAKQATKTIHLHIGYAHGTPLSSGGSFTIPIISSTFDRLKYYFLDLYERKVIKNRPIRSLSLSLSNLHPMEDVDMNLIFDFDGANKELRLEQAMNKIKDRFGKNAILRGINLLNCATMHERNKLIGGHASGEDA